MSNVQYDSLLGGSQDLPSSINLMHFAAARSKEIEAMKQSLTVSTSTKLMFQKLPKHMRRRVMSHNAKRLPRRLREIHLNQLKKSGLPPKQRRPSRKYRRKPCSLMEEYLKRKCKHFWLETHVWHAKRFYMVTKWGYKLPYSPCDKAFRACYRASAKHCLIQDISYFNCLQISGRIDILENKFKMVTCSTTGLTFTAKAFLNGQREGNTMLFKYNSNFKKAIGVVYFHWKPIFNTKNTNDRTLWMWVHAAYYSEALETLINCFDLKDSDETAISDIYYENKLINVVLTEMKNNLNRFRLTGPLSHAILQNSLRTIGTLPVDSDWLKQAMKCVHFKKIYFDQCEYWKNIKNISTPAELAPHTILSLIVFDPRLYLPKVRNKAVPNVEMVTYVKVPDNSSVGPLWDTTVQNAVKDSFVSNAKISELRGELLVSGMDLEYKRIPVPIMLIQRPGTGDGNLGYCSGWDVIIPSKWGQAFWIAFIMNGARAGGLRETDSTNFECGKLNFFAPDTEAGAREELQTTVALKQKFFKLPPNKRINYTKFGIVSPFSYNWKCLIKEWKTNDELVEDFAVLRSKRDLQNIKELLISKKPVVGDINFNKNYLVPVRLKMVNKGSPKAFSIICIPTKRDLLSNMEPIEPLIEDRNKKLRKEIRHSHKFLLKTIRRRRVRAKKKDKVIPVDGQLLNEYTEKMRQLWLPEVTTNIRNSCAREIIGFVTKGEFSFIQAHGAAVGYITMGSISALLFSKEKNKILVRNTSTRQYRFATLEIVV